MRTATIETTHDDAALVAAALAPDNTSEMETTVEDDRVVVRKARSEEDGFARLQESTFGEWLSEFIPEPTLSSEFQRSHIVVAPCRAM